MRRGAAVKVLVLPSYYCTLEQPYSGIFVREQARALQRAGVDVEVLFNYARSLRELSLTALADNHWQVQSRDDDGIFTMRLCGWNPGTAWTQGGHIWAKTTRHLFGRYLTQRGRPDLIHAHCSLWAGYAAFLISKQFGIPYVITEHSSAVLSHRIPRGSDVSIKEAGEHAARFIAVGKGLAAAYQAYSGEPVDIIPNVVDTEFFIPPRNVRRCSPFSYLAFGNLIPRKALHFLVQAFAAQFMASNDVVLRIGGVGPERERLEGLAQDLGIRSKVEFLGALDRRMFVAALQASNVLVLPSLAETFGVVVIEAMSTGIPVIATRCGGPEDIVLPDSGLIVSPGSIEELGSALVQARERTWDGEFIRRSVELRYSPKVVAEALTEVYRCAISGNSV